jgi:hypothetical protein
MMDCFTINGSKQAMREALLPADWLTTCLMERLHKQEAVMQIEKRGWQLLIVVRVPMDSPTTEQWTRARGQAYSGVIGIPGERKDNANDHSNLVAHVFVFLCPPSLLPS